MPIPEREVQDEIESNFEQQANITNEIAIKKNELLEIQQNNWPNQDLQIEVNLMK